VRDWRRRLHSWDPKAVAEGAAGGEMAADGDAAGAADAAEAFVTRQHVLRTHAQVFAGGSNTLGHTVDKVSNALPVKTKTGQPSRTREPAVVVLDVIPLGAWG
jgi:hypothetical protein